MEIFGRVQCEIIMGLHSLMGKECVKYYQDRRFPITLSEAINGLYMTKEKIIDKVKNYERGKIA